MTMNKRRVASLIYITLAVAMLTASAQAFASQLDTVGACNVPIWCPVVTPNQSGSNIFYGGATVSNIDAWAAGMNGTDFATNAHPILQHWDGNTWADVTPAGVPANAAFFGATAMASNNVWAVGFDNYSSPTIQYTLAQHWNGSS